MKSSHLLLIIGIIALLSCQSKSDVNIETEKAEILALEKKQQEYHLNENAEEFVQLFSDQFINVGGGNISTPSKIESYERFNNYFKTVEFIKWEDKQAPIVRISEDGTMAYAVINKEVIVTYMDESLNQKVTDTTHFAWTTNYKKHRGEWKIDCVTSTNK